MKIKILKPVSLVIEKGIVEVSEKQLKNIPISYYELVEDEVENIELEIESTGLEDQVADEVENIEELTGNKKKSSKVKKK